MNDVNALLEKSAATLEETTRRMAELEAKARRHDDDLRELAQKAAGADYAAMHTGPARNPIAKAITASAPMLKALREREQKSGVIRLDHGIHLLRKSVLVGDGSTSNGNYDVQAQRERRIVGEDPRRRLSLIEQLPRIPVTSNSYEYMELDGYASAAAFQANEGAPKAEQDTDFVLRNVPIPTIAVLQNASQQLLADEPGLQFQLDSLMRYGCMRKLESEIIGGSTRIDGIQNQATAYVGVSSEAPLADAIGAMAASLDETGWTATHVLLHPRDWQDIRAERDNENQYVGPGWLQPADPTIWGLAVVTDPSVTQGRPIVMDATQVALLDREQARVDLGYVGNGFATNVITLRCELRASVAVFSPTAVLRLA